MVHIEAEFWVELAQLQAETIGWTALEDGMYLHVADAEATEVLVVGLAREGMQTSNVLWVY